MSAPSVCRTPSKHGAIRAQDLRDAALGARFAMHWRRDGDFSVSSDCEGEDTGYRPRRGCHTLAHRCLFRLAAAHQKLVTTTVTVSLSLSSPCSSPSLLYCPSLPLTRQAEGLRTSRKSCPHAAPHSQCRSHKPNIVNPVSILRDGARNRARQPTLIVILR